MLLLHAATKNAATNKQHVASTAWTSGRNETAVRDFIVVFLQKVPSKHTREPRRVKFAVPGEVKRNNKAE
jgi:hypothetical protein